MNFWLPDPELEEGESFEWRRFANRQQGGRAVGGRLVLTSRRFIFTPHWFDRRMKGREWSAARDAVVGIGVEARSMKGGPFTGGLRPRVRLELDDESEELFVIRDPIGCVEELRSRLGL